MAVAPPDVVEKIPELLYLLHGDPADLQEALEGLRAADIAEALRDLPPEGAAKLMAALPFDLAVRVFDEPELTHHRAEVVRRMGEVAAAPLIDAMSADQQADLFRCSCNTGPTPLAAS
jgi:Mg/Co/Ni transporter MgtE